jgi:SAM-dependent methyltransferase
MCHPSCIEFGRAHLSEADVMNKKVIEVGALDLNGSLRPSVESLRPSSYLGVDIVKGAGVDELCDITDLVARYGKESFDLVICTEVIEHVRDWRKAISNLKHVLKPEGVLLLTTRSLGFPQHCFPADYWRYEVEDIRALFSDLSIEVIENDPQMPGVFLKAHRPLAFAERKPNAHGLYSMILGRRRRRISNVDILLFKARMTLRRVLSRVLPRRLRTIVEKVFFRGEAV